MRGGKPKSRREISTRRQLTGSISEPLATGGSTILGQFANIERINVIGTSGTGKSTFARQLAATLQLPYAEMDALFWKRDWQESSDDEFFPKVHEATSGQRWVLDGNYTRTIPEKWKNVQAVVWLDLSFPRTVYRVTKRAVRRSLSKQELWPGTGNRESLSKAFLSKKSIIWWAITNFRPNRRRYGEMMNDPNFRHIQFVRLNSPKSIAAFLQTAARAAGN